MKHYSKSLDFLLTASQFALKGKHAEAAKYFSVAMAQRDLKATLLALDKLQSDNQVRAQAASTQTTGGPARIAKFLKGKTVAAAPKGKKTTADTDADIFRETLDSMSSEEADVDDILELPAETAGDDNGQGESDLDVGNDDASDLDFSPAEETSDMDFTDLADLDDLSDEDFGDDDFGDDVEANTTGEGDLETRPDPECDPNDTPEGDTAPDLPPVPKPEDTTVTSKLKKPTATEQKAQLTKVHKNLAALSRMTTVTQAARVASRPARQPVKPSK